LALGRPGAAPAAAQGTVCRGQGSAAGWGRARRRSSSGRWRWFVGAGVQPGAGEGGLEPCKAN